MATLERYKLRKLLLALETAETLAQLGRFPGWKLHSLKGDLVRFYNAGSTDNSKRPLP